MVGLQVSAATQSFFEHAAPANMQDLEQELFVPQQRLHHTCINVATATRARSKLGRLAERAHHDLGIELELLGRLADQASLSPNRSNHNVWVVPQLVCRTGQGLPRMLPVLNGFEHKLPVRLQLCTK